MLEELINPYHSAISALGVLAILMLVQLIIADVLGISNRHVPGTPVEANHAYPLFRAGRVVGNTNESIAIFLCALLFCIFAKASPTYTAYATWGFVVLRGIYAVCYYSNQSTARSITFALSLLALLALILIGFFTA